jgi:N-methylhydantoinase A/oxoprolinase/acetone carboxylase beta subunit
MLPRYRPRPLGLARAVGGASGAAQPPRREVLVKGTRHATPVLQRRDLAPGERRTGPLIVEQPDTTTFVPPGWSAECDQYGNLSLSTEEI